MTELSQDEHRRLIARNLCFRCRIRPRTGTKSICYFCSYARRKERKLERIRQRIEVAEVTQRELMVYYFRTVLDSCCALCEGPIPDPITQRKAIRFVCKKCYKGLVHNKRIDRNALTSSIFHAIRQAVERVKRDKGIPIVTSKEFWRQHWTSDLGITWKELQPELTWREKRLLREKGEPDEVSAMHAPQAS